MKNFVFAAFCISILFTAPASYAGLTVGLEDGIMVGVDLSPKHKRQETLFPANPFTDIKSSVLLGVNDMEKKPAAAAANRADFKNSVGIPFVSVTLFEWAKYSRHNELIGFRGINYGLGYQSKNYFDPPVKDKWNPFWQWGTFFVLLPYVGIGTEYTTNNVYFEIATVFIFPYLGLGVHF